MIDSFIQQVPFILYIDMAQPMAFQISPLGFAKNRMKPKKPKNPQHSQGRELWEMFGKGVGSSLYVSLSVHFS